MRLKGILFGAAVIAAASIAVAGPARADTPLCFGTQSTVVLCSDPRGGRLLYCGGNIGQYVC